MDDSPTQHGRIARASAVVEGAADGLAEGIEREGLDESLPHLADQGAGIARRGARSERLRARLEDVDEKVTNLLHRTRGKARAVAESARRARTVPPAVARDLGAAAKAYATGVGGLIGFYAAAGLVGAAALVVLTVGLVQGLERVWGEPWGALAVALGYGLIAVMLAGAARSRMTAGRHQARERVEVARAELRHVTEPVRNAFRRDPPAADPDAINVSSATAATTPMTSPISFSASEPTSSTSFSDRSRM